MKLAFSTNAYTQFPLVEALRGIKKAGYAGVEILADVPHAYPDAQTTTLVNRVRAELDLLELEVSNINCNCTFGYWKDAPPEAYFEPSLISPNPLHRADRQRMIAKSIDFARAIGAANISITSGRMLGGMPPEKAATQFAESIRPILDHADYAGINVGVECEPGLYVEYVAELRHWIDTLAHPRLGGNLDIGHCQVIGESIPDVVKTLGDRIWNLHVEDIPGRKHYHMIPGEGTLDWSGLRGALKGIDYDRYLTVELYTHTSDPQSAAEKSFAFLDPIFADAPITDVSSGERV